MLSKNDFDMASIGEKPTALFMIIQDEKTTYHSLATIFIKQCYECLISTAYKHGGSLPVRTNFLLDEFANMPKIKDIATMVTAARSRHIKFTFIIQNFAQLDKTYGKEDAQTIRGNCINTIYLLTGELSALEEISKLCGDKIVRVGKDKKEETRPLVTISELQRMKPDEYILVRHRCPPYKGKLKMDYNTDFGFGVGASLYGVDVEYPERTMDEVKTFSVKDYVKKKKSETMNNGFNGMPPYGGMPNFGGMPNPYQTQPTPPRDNMFNNSQDIDELIKNIDKQIAAIEEEERREREKKQETPASVEEKPAETIVEKPVEEIVSEPEKPAEIEPKVEDLAYKPVEKVTENEPNVSEIIPSNDVNFDTFEVKEKEEKKPVNDESDYDDFFDDFFDE